VRNRGHKQGGSNKVSNGQKMEEERRETWRLNERSQKREKGEKQQSKQIRGSERLKFLGRLLHMHRYKNIYMSRCLQKEEFSKH